METTSFSILPNPSKTTIVMITAALFMSWKIISAIELSFQLSPSQTCMPYVRHFTAHAGVH